MNRKMRNKQSDVIVNTNDKRRTKNLSIGSTSSLHLVYIRNFGKGSLWLKGRIVNNHGPVTWLVKLDDGQVIQRHAY